MVAHNRPRTTDGENPRGSFRITVNLSFQLPRIWQSESDPAVFCIECQSAGGLTEYTSAVFMAGILALGARMSELPEGFVLVPMEPRR